MKPTILAGLLILGVGLAPRNVIAEEGPGREKIRVEWAPALSFPMGYVIVKGDEAVPLSESFGESGTVRKMLEDCAPCKEKMESSRRNSRAAAIMGGVALGGVLGGIVLFSAQERIGVFLPLTVAITGYGLLYPSMNYGRSAQQDLFDAIRIYNAQTP